MDLFFQTCVAVLFIFMASFGLGYCLNRNILNKNLKNIQPLALFFLLLLIVTFANAPHNGMAIPTYVAFSFLGLYVGIFADNNKGNDDSSCGSVCGTC